MNKQYLIYYDKRPPFTKNKVLGFNIQTIPQAHRKYLRYTKWKSTPAQIEFHEEVDSEIIDFKPPFGEEEIILKCPDCKELIFISREEIE